MTEDARITTICVDFGMTGSTFRWKDNITCRTWSRVADGKIPTKLVFDTESEDGPPVAWGSQLIGIFAENTRECFKQLMVVDRSKFAELIEPFAPASQIELHHWIREYLRAFCAQAMVTIDIALPLTWKKASIDWSFTVPGCWNQLPVVEDFRRLAEEALSSILQEAKDLRVHTNITEASASAMSLVVGGLVAHEKACPIGDTIISCDIGGSTTDIGLSKICSPGVLEPLGHLRLNPSGFITIEKDIFLHVRETLTNAGADGPTGLALRLVRHPATIDNIVDFTDKLGQDWIKIHFYPDCTVGNWSPSPQAGSKKSYIKDLSLYIHKHVFAGFLDKLAQEIEEGIDEAIVAARLERVNPNIIGFCGGVSRSTYISNRLGKRYADFATIVNFRDLGFAPEMATVIGNCMIWDQNQLRTYISQTSFGIEKKDSITWLWAEICKDPSTIQTPYAWVVRFSCGKRGSLNKHRIFALSATKPTPDTVLEGLDMTMKLLPGTAQEALKISGCRSWTVVVYLNEEKGWNISRKREYQVICKVVGVGMVDIRAQSLSTNAEMPCQVVEDT